jgi:hypothetical protein
MGAAGKRPEEQKKMATNYPQAVAPASGTVEDARTAEGLGERMMDRVRRAVCALHGHDTLLQFEQERMFLKCVSCGHETPGWELNEAPPTVSVRGDARRHAMARQQLISARRIA